MITQVKKNKSGFTHAPRTLVRGFTLIEMVVVLTIFSFIAISLFVKNSEFNSKVILTNLAYEVALSIRQAQVYGLSARELTPGSGEFNTPYGVNFNVNSSGNYIFFADIDEDGIYDGQTELLETYSFKRGNQAGRFCATTVGEQVMCSDLNQINVLNITFKRPNPDAIILTDQGQTYKSARIYVRAPNGEERQISIEDTGQISINPAGAEELESGLGGGLDEVGIPVDPGGPGMEL